MHCKIDKSFNKNNNAKLGKNEIQKIYFYIKFTRKNIQNTDIQYFENLLTPKSLQLLKIILKI
ncbi:hypothetical protein NBRC110019_22120 [Neptunitalea chrysea]|uniref:Uncharacterized protein n=1 Tax=Neptunitalea chrysea TaxID=1647581 RepID=A0A9W6B831_9FLAO|nr:hypothetical protein NBRC110019_22120 [Neptunitalea chrysea]